ncbi:glutamate racemase [bacterium]|nr:glutamate racemase [bacterium]
MNPDPEQQDEMQEQWPPLAGTQMPAEPGPDDNDSSIDSASLADAETPLAPESTPADASSAAAGQFSAQTVGVFDSGVGGFTVAQAILSLRPELNLVYFGDSLNLPYGEKSPQQLHRLSHGNIDFLIGRGCDLVAIGCQTSNSILRQEELDSYPVPVLDLVGTTIQWLREQAQRPQRIAILATPATIRARYWERQLENAFTGIRVRPVACPELVPLIEAQVHDRQRILRALQGYLEPLIDDGISDIILGCTHYPLLLDYIYEIDPGLNCIDPSQCLARRLAASLPAAPSGGRGQRHFYSSRPGERFYVMGQRVFGEDIRPQTRMCIVNLYED